MRCLKKISRALICDQVIAVSDQLESGVSAIIFRYDLILRNPNRINYV